MEAMSIQYDREVYASRVFVEVYGGCKCMLYSYVEDVVRGNPFLSTIQGTLTP